MYLKTPLDSIPLYFHLYESMLENKTKALHMGVCEKTVSSFILNYP